MRSFVFSSSIPIRFKNETGKTKDQKYQAGIRRTLAYDKDRLWAFVTSADGMAIIAEDAVDAHAPMTESKAAPCGVTYRITTFVDGSHFRMQWKLPAWDSYTVLQVRVIPAGPGKSTLSIHQEKLSDASTRRHMLEHWERRIEEVREEMEAMEGLQDRN